MSADVSVGRQQGTLADWNDDRGFGFIAPAAGGPRVFVHVSAFPRGRRPLAGCEVSYAAAVDESGRPRATQVRLVDGAASRQPASGTSVALGVVAAFVAIQLGLVALDELSVVIVAAYGVLSLVTFVVYAADKSAARKGTWRTAESTLHTLALVGGWPGALLARHVLRHKTVKQPFRTVFWLTVGGNCAALAALVLAGPQELPGL